MKDEETKTDVEQAEPAAPEQADTALAEAPSDELVRDGDAEQPPAAVPAMFGAKKYVHAAFFAFGMLAAFLVSKMLLGAWNRLADWPTAASAVPALLRYGEDERATITTVAGALVGVLTVIQTYRREKVRTYADEVASELAKVSWPNKETVTNGTIVVVIASAIATVYVTLLDRLWSFVTTIVYGGA